ncbi:MAG TPA: 4a-hydroxytetrahydrobiopterin dehydratase [Verrucomicrobiae bacterium]|nr:4a-hydroxytetrahydrobiopterin dehydratase [Verrucomicrobiae bacterium]
MNEISELNNWKEKDGKLCKEFRFSNFIESFGFVTRIALESEKKNHHPDITISYNKVSIELITHDINKISEKDIDLAKSIDKLNKSST